MLGSGAVTPGFKLWLITSRANYLPSLGFRVLPCKQGH